jgi:LysR family hydrogen peroxide-inducible transcriptional activator
MFLLAVPADDPLPARARVSLDDIDQRRLILLEEGHCLRDQALAFCARNGRDRPAGLGATSLTTVMQMVANGLGVTLLPEVAAKAEARNERVKLLRLTKPVPMRTIGLAWRPTSPRKRDFTAFGEIVKQMLGNTSFMPIGKTK